MIFPPSALLAAASRYASTIRGRALLLYVTHFPAPRPSSPDGRRGLRIMTNALARGSAKARPSGQIFEPEPVVPALDVANRRRREVHRAAQRVAIAVAFQERAPGLHRLVAVGVDAHHQLGI